ncbi:unnamed protein product [Pieris brassicae]|uniref:Uncharacterized protein n=1 Tax=Pieris brassicae TaxID=7116 RepID=A0A9P0TP84_PIEBR|nr:unnamed protein product [Pieris brassicae]
MNMPNADVNRDQVDVVIINKQMRVIHCCDGVEEEIEETMLDEINMSPNDVENIEPQTLSWGPWISYYTWKSGTKLLKVVDYAGETLADFFGITTPKYQIEINEYERIQEENKRLEEESAGWVPRNIGGDIPLVLNEPVRDKHTV